MKNLFKGIIYDYKSLTYFVDIKNYNYVVIIRINELPGGIPHNVSEMSNSPSVSVEDDFLVFNVSKKIVELANRSNLDVSFIITFLLKSS